MRSLPIVAILALVCGPAIANSVSNVGHYDHTVGAQVGYGTPSQDNPFAIAMTLMREQQYGKAIPYLTQAHEALPHEAPILNFLAYAHQMNGDSDLALMFYKRALDENPNLMLAHQYLGQFYLDQHDLASAQAQMAELVRLCPTSCDMRDQLAQSISAYQTANGAPAQQSQPVKTSGSN